jgi:protein-S-isoprenylcysteine O-methyltransferase Ste14
MSPLNRQALRSSLLGLATLLALLFIPAGTWRYWQAWLFTAVFGACTSAITLYLARRNPALLQRRMKVGPKAEGQAAQKIIMSLALASWVALLMVPALDRRFGWSAMPAALSLAGDALVVLGFLLIFRVLQVNSYSASTIQVEQGQQVISSGPYAWLRHPMYAGALPLVAGMPLALGSWWACLALLPFPPVLVWRLLDEERYLRARLPGYADYCRRVRHRLLPGIW